MITVRPMRPTDADIWIRMRATFWPDGSLAEHAGDVSAFFAGSLPQLMAVLLAEDADGRPIGFAELSIRGYAEGCTSSKVAYLEGWYVVPEMRRQGVGGALVRAAEEWGRSQGCTEFASDAEVANQASAAAHQALGFAEAGVVRCFYKPL